ncbi:Ig-like domain-containing protein [Methanosphaera sp. WGK6]|uniref:Ig-like domain-containing protein n=1 Tax=Methanosphaera sp. WGK6 TaxID=1561964 RepID=UPI00084C4D06|nr:Ig-like domain-containing protein [Methanosphaera sp. WGK6]OED30492.1 hypothetical protein NL43_02405 [Methanosphaera sp. WGK6]
MKKSYLLSLCIILILLTVTTISAADNTTNSNDDLNTDTISIDRNYDNTVSTQKIIKKESDYTDVYVNISSNIITGDGSITNPYTTLNQTNLNQITNNSHIHITEGTYYLKSMTITKNLTITGQNRNTIFIANDTKSIFNITETGYLQLINIILKDYTSQNSGAITNLGTLIIENSTFTNNRAETTNRFIGGSITNNGTLSISNSEFSNNYAAYGASINTYGTTHIINSTFSNDYVQTVGGSIYNSIGSMTVKNSKFIKNRATSGGAIYNAKGVLIVNNSQFINNTAATFFGGAIYSTGVTNTTNSQFIENNARKDGGAILNTNNFTVINCLFNSNYAEENGGAIKNIPWTSSENGNLTILYCNFTENSAVKNGGAIVGFNSTEVSQNYGTIYVRNSIFQENSAGESGGSIHSYNNNYIDLENCVLLDNEAENYIEIYTPSTFIKSIENNWWGVNEPRWRKIGITPNTWVVMTVTRTITNENTQIKINLNTLNTNKTLNGTLPPRIVKLEDTTTQNNYIINGTLTINSNSSKTIIISIDNEEIITTQLTANINYKLTNNNNNILFNITTNKNTGKISIKINGITIINKHEITSTSTIINYTIPTSWNKQKYKTTIIITSDNSKIEENKTITIPKRSVTTKITINTNSTKINAGKTIQITVEIKCGNQYLTTGKVVFKINGKTIGSTISIKNGTATINYIIPSSYSAKTYNLSIVYGGDGNKNANRNSTTLTIQKQTIHTNTTSLNFTHSGNKTKISIKFLDIFNNSIKTPIKLNYTINGKTIENNKVITNSILSFEYTIPTTSTSKQTLTIINGENSKYNKLTINIPITIQ